MPFRSALPALTLVLACVAVGAARAQDRIPPVHSTTFAGQKVSLPDDLKGHAAILILGFTEGSRDQTTAWGKRLAADPARPAALLYFEMPMVEGVPRLLRGLVLHKIKETVSDNGQKHFLPVEEHEPDWKRIVAYGKPDDAYVLVIDENGVVRERLEGAADDGAYARVEQAVRQLTGGQ